MSSATVHTQVTGPLLPVPPVSLPDLGRLAAERLPAEYWDFLAGGSGEELTLAANRAALDAVALVPRVPAGGEARTATRLLGGPAAMPVAVAPMAYQRLAHPDGEIAAAAAARDCGIPYVAGVLGSCPIEEVAAVGATTWFQLYWLRDRAQTLELLGRAEQSGCRALMVTVDVPVMGRRLRDLRNGFTLPPGITAANLAPEQAVAGLTRAAGRSAVAAHTTQVFDPALSWRDLEWLREHTELPLVVKGVLDRRDAGRAAEIGASAVVVSNHGGRQLDGALPSIAALAPAVEAVAGRAEVFLDSGVRSGTDVLRALALGATGVLIGRPVLWGLAVDGADGVRRVLDLLATELRDALTLAGCSGPAAARELRTLTPRAWAGEAE